MLLRHPELAGHSPTPSHPISLCLSDFLARLKTSPASQDGGVGKHSSLPYTTMAKIATKLQNSYHSESSENGAVWKSSNRRIKEVTFMQMGRRGGDMEMWNGRCIPIYGG